MTFLQSADTKILSPGTQVIICKLNWQPEKKACDWDIDGRNQVWLRRIVSLNMEKSQNEIGNLWSFRKITIKMQGKAKIFQSNTVPQALKFRLINWREKSSSYGEKSLKSEICHKYRQIFAFPAYHESDAREKNNEFSIEYCSTNDKLSI